MPWPALVVSADPCPRLDLSRPAAAPAARPPPANSPGPSRRCLPDTRPRCDSRKTARAWPRSMTSSRPPGSRTPVASPYRRRWPARAPGAGNPRWRPQARRSRCPGARCCRECPTAASRATRCPLAGSSASGGAAAHRRRSPPPSPRSPSPRRSSAPARLSASRGQARDNSPSDSRPARARYRPHGPPPSAAAAPRRHARGFRSQGLRSQALRSRRLGRGLRRDRLIVIVEQWNAEVEQDLVDLALALLDQTVELALPVLVGVAHAHADPVGKLRPGRLLDQRHHMQRRTGLLRVIARHRAPQHAGIDRARLDVIDHRRGRGVDPGIDHQRIRLGIHHQAVDSHVGGRRCAGDDADMLAFQARISERRNVVETTIGLDDQRIGGAVVRIGHLHEIVALRKAHDQIATVRTERHANEAGGLREKHVVEFLLQLRRQQFSDLVLESLAFFI